MGWGKNSLKGKYKVKNPSKYRGNTSNVVYRSSWELKLMCYLDSNSTVKMWSSETVIVPYRSPKDDAIHRYFIDFYAEIIDTTGKLRKFLIEVKPFSQTQEPKPPKKQTKGFLEECLTYGINQAKWKAAEIFAEKNGLEFIKMTELELGIVK